MNWRNSGWMALPILVVGITAMGPCADQGLKNSYGQFAARSYGPDTEAQYTALLKKYVDSDSFVFYAPWYETSSDVQTLKAVLQAMSGTDESSFTPAERKAFYLNAYNAMTLDLILSHYPETSGGAQSPLPGKKSIRNIQNLDFSVWKSFHWVIAGKSRSLDEVENSVLRPMGDSRIHFGINCASVGCPPLYSSAFTADGLDSLLDQLANGFVNSGRSTKIDVGSKSIMTSPILQWFAVDFIRDFGTVSAFFARYGDAQFGNLSSFSVGYVDYDWTLNESSRPWIPGGVPGTSAGGPSTPTPSPSPCYSPGPGSGTEHPVPCPSPTPSPSPGSGTERGI